MCCNREKAQIVLVEYSNEMELEEVLKEIVILVVSYGIPCKAY